MTLKGDSKGSRRFDHTVDMKNGERVVTTLLVIVSARPWLERLTEPT